jgi:hypothetical protein
MCILSPLAGRRTWRGRRRQALPQRRARGRVLVGRRLDDKRLVYASAGFLRLPPLPCLRLLDLHCLEKPSLPLPLPLSNFSPLDGPRQCDGAQEPITTSKDTVEHLKFFPKQRL